MLAVRQGSAPAAAPSRYAFVLIEGAVYGLDADSGPVLWRRHVGYETLVPPQQAARDAGSDALVADGIGPAGLTASEVIDRARSILNARIAAGER